MASGKSKFYVVWKGHVPGVYRTWADCQSAIAGYSGHQFKSFPTWEAAQAAFRDGARVHLAPSSSTAQSRQAAAQRRATQAASCAGPSGPVTPSLCVDAAWNSVTKFMEYRGVWYPEGELAFEQGPFPDGTNNLGEFLAIVHGLALLKSMDSQLPIYSDSKTALVWVRNRQVKSKPLRDGEAGAKIVELVDRALKWLEQNKFSNQLLKWETERWGDVPADYGRK